MEASELRVYEKALRRAVDHAWESGLAPEAIVNIVVDEVNARSLSAPVAIEGYEVLGLDAAEGEGRR